MTRFMRGMLGAVLGLVFIAAPAMARAPAEPASAAMACVIEPGTYGIVDSRGELVAILIVYPDCRVEVYRRTEVV